MNTESGRALMSPLSAPIVAQPGGVSAQALAVRESTSMQSAMLLARTYPRDEEAAEKKIRKAFARLPLAEEGLYEYAKGGTKVGDLSIRSAEELQRLWGSIVSGVEETRGATSSEVLTYAMDLETLTRDVKLFTVPHWIDTREGGRATRDEREKYELVANLAARRKRANILALIPEYIKSIARAEIERTLAAQTDTSPARVAAMLEAFKTYNVTLEMIEKKIQSNILAITPNGMVTLRNVFNSLRDGIAKVGDFFEVTAAAPGAVDAETASRSNTDRIKETLRGKQAAAEGGGRAGKKKEPDAAHVAQAAAQMSGVQAGIPFYTQASAIAALRGCTKRDGLDVMWKDIVRDYRESDRELPVEIEDVYNGLVDVFDEQSPPAG